MNSAQLNKHTSTCGSIGVDLAPLFGHVIVGVVDTV